MALYPSFSFSLTLSLLLYVLCPIPFAYKSTMYIALVWSIVMLISYACSVFFIKFLPNVNVNVNELLHVCVCLWACAQQQQQQQLYNWTTNNTRTHLPAFELVKQWAFCFYLFFYLYFFLMTVCISYGLQRSFIESHKLCVHCSFLALFNSFNIASPSGHPSSVYHTCMWYTVCAPWR